MASNILNHNRRLFTYDLFNKEYWDFHIHLKEGDSIIADSDGCLSAFIDTDIKDCHLQDKGLISLSDYTYSKSVNKDLVLENIGLTGMDNGLITFDKDTITEEEFDELYSDTALDMSGYGTRVVVHPVDGNNKVYSYEIKEETVEGESTDKITVAKLNGGFYQGFFAVEDGCEYKTLPMNIGNGISMEFKLMMTDGEKSEGLPTLNDQHPKNKGIFFYVGTRAENKWIRYYDEVCSGSDADELMPERVTETKDGNLLSQANIVETETDNKYLFFNRTKEGYTTHTWNDDIDIILRDVKDMDDENYFLLTGHNKDGLTVKELMERKKQASQRYSALKDLFYNALAFYVSEEGAVGYKYMVPDCDNECGYKIETEQTKDGNVTKDKWSLIHIQLAPNTSALARTNTHTPADDKMKIRIYVDGKLRLVSKELPMLRLRMLDEVNDKQEGVAYNISLGGGTQGLCDVIYEDYKNIPEFAYPLEDEFGGSFIGYFKEFKFYECLKTYEEILFNYEKSI